MIITNIFSFWEIFAIWQPKKLHCDLYKKKDFCGGWGEKKAPKSPDFLGLFFPL